MRYFNSIAILHPAPAANPHGLGMHVCTGLDSSVSMNPQIHRLWILLSQRGIPSPEGVIKFRHCSRDWKLSGGMFITGGSASNYTITITVPVSGCPALILAMHQHSCCYHQFCAAAIQAPIKAIQRQIKGGA